MRPHVLAGLLGGIESLAIQARAAAAAAGADLWELFGDSPHANAWTTSDGSGANAVTGDPLGRVNAVQRNLELGPEHVTNGAFDTNLSGWYSQSSAGGELLWSAGKLVVRNTTGTGRAGQDIAVSAGKTYQVQFTCPHAFITGHGWYLGSTGGGIDLVNSRPPAPGINTVIVKAPTSLFSLSFKNFGVGSDLVVDDVSVREVYGNHLTQSTAAAKPTAILGANGRPLMSFDGGDKLVGPSAASPTTESVIVACSWGPDTTAQTAVGRRNDTSGWMVRKAQSSPVVSLYVNTGAATVAVTFESTAAGIPAVYRGLAQSGASAAWLNGELVGTLSDAFAPLDSSFNLALGNDHGTANVAAFTGTAGLVCYLAGATFTDAQAKAIERYAAALVGATYLG